MSTSNEFDPNMLDTILNDDGIHEVEQKIEQNKQLVNQKAEVDVAHVYQELEELVSLGNSVLKNAKYAVEMDPTGEGVLAGTASMIHAVGDVVKEFTKIHLQNLKFEQQVQLEQMKQKGREKLVELRSQGNDNGDIEDMWPYSQEEIIKAIEEEG